MQRPMNKCTFPDCPGGIKCDPDPLTKQRKRTPYEAYWDGWNDACDAVAQMSWWKRAIAELKRPGYIREEFLRGELKIAADRLEILGNPSTKIWHQRARKVSEGMEGTELGIWLAENDQWPQK